MKKQLLAILAITVILASPLGALANEATAPLEEGEPIEGGEPAEQWTAEPMGQDFPTYGEELWDDQNPDMYDDTPTEVPEDASHNPFGNIDVVDKKIEFRSSLEESIAELIVGEDAEKTMHDWAAF